MKKLTKKLILIAAMMSMLFAYGNAAHAEDKPFNKIESQVYLSYYSENLVDKYPDAVYDLVDLNNDGVLEYLLIVPSGVRQKVMMYTFLKGKIQRIGKKEFGTSSNFEGYNKSTGKFVISTSDGYANSTYTVYTLKGKTLKAGVTYKSTYNSKTQKEKFYNNKKKISKKSFINAIQKYSTWEHPMWAPQPKG